MATIQVLPQLGANGVLSVESVKKVGRKERRPSNPFYLQYKPYDLQPFMIHPVLPGETMKNALLQARCVTDPIKNPLVGWWNEYYLFYVKLSDLRGFNVEGSMFEALSNMLLTNTALGSGFLGGTAAPYYQRTGGADYLYNCMERIVAHYFRDEEEWDADGYCNVGYSGSEGVFRAKQLMNNTFQSLAADVDVPKAETEELPGTGYDALPAHLSGFADAFAQWQELVAMQMTAATFDDWLKQFGVTAPRELREELHRPELLRYVREYQYPSNTVNPADGSVASAVSWSVAARADKDRFFAEPGFIVGVTTSRPKVYLGKQQGYTAQFMLDAYSWLPAVLQDAPYTSLKKFDDAGLGPLAGQTGDYWIDLRDLFVHGEQFVNVPLDAAHTNVVQLPIPATGEEKESAYPSDADVASFFASSEAATVRVDGRCDLNILSRLDDTTP